MVADEEGFLYPSIGEDLCVDCGKCVKVCAFRNLRFPESAGPYFAASAKDVDLSKSASGGLFASLAAKVIEKGGGICGCSYGRENGVLVARHELVGAAEDLNRLLGSKYVQSFVGDSYRRVKNLLASGKRVLFCGTPCQVAGLRAYLGHEEENLLLVDLVCHGVPSQKMFTAFQEFQTISNDCEVIDIVFRDKKEGWSRSLLLFQLLRSRSTGEDFSFRTFASDCSYYDLFLKFETFRPSCYSCPYANCDRPGDLTIGDFWGIESRRPDLLEPEDSPFSLKDGVSCLLVNNEHGREMLDRLDCNIAMSEVELADITDGNSQLRMPCVKGRRRDEYLALLAEEGYAAVELRWEKCHKREVAAARLKQFIPPGAKQLINRIFRRS